MRRSDTSMYRRLAAVIVGLTVVVAILFSAFYIVAEADHDCSGENCHICAVIRLAEDLLRGMGSGFTVQSYVLRRFVIAINAVLILTAVSFSDTPVARKVRLNN